MDFLEERADNWIRRVKESGACEGGRAKGLVNVELLPMIAEMDGVVEIGRIMEASPASLMRQSTAPRSFGLFLGSSFVATLSYGAKTDRRESSMKREVQDFGWKRIGGRPD